MANMELYPPSVNDYIPAFIVADNRAETSCRLYYSLSPYSNMSVNDIKGVQISVTLVSTGENAVSIEKSENNRYRSSGIIILNGKPQNVAGENNLYYVDILNEDIKEGWSPKTVYRIQIRLSLMSLDEDDKTKQSIWLVKNGDMFSEWSSYSITKATAAPTITFQQLDYKRTANSSSADDNITNIAIRNFSTLVLKGEYENKDDKSEILYSYKFELYNSSNEKVEDSGEILTNQYHNPNVIEYMFKHNFDTDSYLLYFTYTTINKFTFTDTIYFENELVSVSGIEITPYTANNIDNLKKDAPQFVQDFYNETNITREEEEGYIGIKLRVSEHTQNYTGAICVRRASAQDGYTYWSTVSIINCNNTDINKLSIIKDFLIESGVRYRYSVQTIKQMGDMYYYSTPIRTLAGDEPCREFDYSFILGEGGRQLALKFNNTLSSYNYNVSENKTDTIGGKYPFIFRNGNMYYRTFPINGLISYNMDDAYNFFQNEEYIKEHENKDLDKPTHSSHIPRDTFCYPVRGENFDFGQRRFKKEFDFREEVLAFFQDGKPKLFKSPTEGNIIVYLTQVSATPNQTLNRMICDFSATANEVAEATMENYAKYGFYNPGVIEKVQNAKKEVVGQITLNLNDGDNLIKKLFEAYTHLSEGGLVINASTIKEIKGLTLEFNNLPYIIDSTGNHIMVGYQFEYNDKTFYLDAYHTNTYTFDENIVFDQNSVLRLKAAPPAIADSGDLYFICSDMTLNDNGDLVMRGDEPHFNITWENGDLILNTKTNNSPPIEITVNFTYIVEENYDEVRILMNKKVERVIGQFYECVSTGTDIMQILTKKYQDSYGPDRAGGTEAETYLEELNWIRIEAEPGTKFEIIDGSNASSRPITFVVNETGLLNIEGITSIKQLKYVSEKDSDIIVDYLCYIITDTYTINNNG